MKKVLIYGMSNNPGGIETYLLNYYRRNHGKSVHLDFVSDFPTVVEADALQTAGSKIYYIPAKGKGLVPHWKALWKVLREHKEYRTLYFNVMDAGSVFTMLIPFLLGRKIVVHSHNGNTDKVKLHKLCKPFANCLIGDRVACSRLAADHMFGRNGTKALVIPNSIDVRKYTFNPAVRQAMREKLGLGDKLTVCHVGRLSRQKNPFGVLDMFEALHRMHPNSVLLSVGTGELEKEFHEAIKAKGLEGAVMCLGVRSDVPEILQAADVFLLPSLYEGLPIALLEAQAAGLPCVVSDAITREVAVTNLVTYVSLETPAQDWAVRILQSAQAERTDTFDQLATAGFDISRCAEFDSLLNVKFN